MDYINAILLGIIEGITEFLPISSDRPPSDRRTMAGRPVRHVQRRHPGRRDPRRYLLSNWQRILSLLLGFRRDPENRDYLLKLIVAFLITAVLGLIVTKMGFKLPESVVPIAWALIIGGIWMIVAEQIGGAPPGQSKVTWPVAITRRPRQIVSLGVFPGTSRSGATIFAAMLSAPETVLRQPSSPSRRPPDHVCRQRL